MKCASCTYPCCATWGKGTNWGEVQRGCIQWQGGTPTEMATSEHHGNVICQLVCYWLIDARLHNSKHVGPHVRMCAYVVVIVHARRLSFLLASVWTGVHCMLHVHKCTHVNACARVCTEKTLYYAAQDRSKWSHPLSNVNHHELAHFAEAPAQTMPHVINATWHRPVSLPVTPAKGRSP